jgi:molecular chaperone GrpE
MTKKKHVTGDDIDKTNGGDTTDNKDINSQVRNEGENKEGTGTDNYRKRTLREKIELTKHAGENILISIVPVMDDFDRALSHMETGSDSAAMKSGIDLIYGKFNDFLKQHGIKEIESLHSEFNVDLHEALSKIPVEDEKLKGKVVEVLQKGYYLHDKVMRFSKVIVGE